MLGKLSAALLLAASPALAAVPALAPAAPVPEAQAPAPPEYTTKKVCRTYEVAGSSIPRKSCVTKKIPVKKPDTQTPEAAKVEATPSDTSGAQKQQ